MPPPVQAEGEPVTQQCPRSETETGHVATERKTNFRASTQHSTILTDFPIHP